MKMMIIAIVSLLSWSVGLGINQIKKVTCEKGLSHRFFSWEFWNIIQSSFFCYSRRLLLLNSWCGIVEVYLGVYQTSSMEAFSKNKKKLKVVCYFRKKFSSLTFHKFLNIPLNCPERNNKGRRVMIIVE